MSRIKTELLSLSPLALFLVIYATASAFAGDFSRIPVSAVFVIACIYAVIISKGTLQQRLDAFSSGGRSPTLF